MLYSDLRSNGAFHWLNYFEIFFTIGRFMSACGILSEQGRPNSFRFFGAIATYFGGLAYVGGFVYKNLIQN